MASERANLVASIDSLDCSSFTSEDERVVTLRAAQALCTRLESPYESVMRLTYQEPTYRFALQIADKTSVFKHLAASATPVSTEQLAAASGAEAAFLKRVLRHLSAKGTIVQHSADTWGSTALSKALSGPAGSANVRAIAKRAESVFSAGPSFFEANGFKTPRDGLYTIYQHAHGCPGVGMFERLRKPENADQWRDFNLTIGWNTQHRVSWMDVCPPDTFFRDAHNPAAVAFVDIGGGTGSDVAEVRRRFPLSVLPAQIVLQEQAHVIETATEMNQSGELAGTLNGVELKIHDFWAPQPIRGAKIYYLSSVLHDWPDAEAKRILEHVVDAMTRAYSVLLINENVVPETGCLPQLTGMDLTMMAMLAAKERTETDWQVLLASVGLRISKIHTIPSCTKAVIEAELTD